MTSINNGEMRGVKQVLGMIRTSGIDKTLWYVLFMGIGCM